MAVELTRLTAAQIAAAVAAGEVSAVEVTQAHLDRIAGVDSDVHAFLHVAGVGALAAAEDVDRKTRVTARDFLVFRSREGFRLVSRK